MEIRSDRIINIYFCFMLLFIGGPEIFIILLFVVLFFGANKIPELARGLGKAMRELKDASNEIKKDIRDSSNKLKDDFDLDK